MNRQPSEATRQLLRAAAVLAALVALYFALIIATGGLVDSDMGVRADPVRRVFENGGERFFLFLPWFLFEAKKLAAGRLPVWSPFAGCGAPFIGKQQPGLFYPLHILFYLRPSPYAWTALLALRHFLAGLFAFLLARGLSLGFEGALLAGGLFMFSNQLVSWGMEAQTAADLLVPLLLLVTEQFFTGRRRRALAALPVVVGLLALSGHSETALRAYLLAGGYFCWRLYRGAEVAPRERGRALLAYLGCSAAGALVAAAQLIPAQEYYARSYLLYRRASPDVTFYLANMAKRLSSGDAPPVLVALAAAAAAAFSLRRLLKEAAKRPALAAAWGGACAAALAAAAACLLNTGLWQDPLEILGFSWSGAGYAAWVNLAAGALAYFLAALALTSDKTPPKLKFFGWAFLVGLLFYLQTPPLVQLADYLPLWNQTYYAHSNNFAVELGLALALLAAAGWDRLRRLDRESVPARRRAAGLAAGVCAVLALGLAGGLRAADAAGTLLGSGINPLLWSSSENESAGGVADAGQLVVKDPRPDRLVRGWVADAGERPRVAVGFSVPGRPVEMVPAQVSARGRRWLFRARAPLPAGLGGAVPVALVDTAKGRALLRGSRLERQAPREGSAGEVAVWLAFLAAAALAATSAGKVRLLPAAAAALLLAEVFVLGLRLSVLHPSDYIPPVAALRLPQRDQGRYRIFSRDNDLLTPEGGGLYGLRDLRSLDAVGVMAHSHFSRLAYYAAFSAGPSKAALGATLLGLANVGYVIERPGTPVDEKLYEPVYRGELDVYRNRRAMPRAVLFERAVHVPGDPDGWESGLTLLERLYGLMDSGKLDPATTLALQDPVPSLPEGRDASVRSPRARVVSDEDDRVSVEVAAPRAAFLFLSDTYFPGWRAEIDGRAAPLLRAWVNFRAVPVPAGRHVVRFRYDPASLRWALAVSGGAALFLLALGLRLAREPAGDGDGRPWFALGDAAALGLLGLSAAFWLLWAVFAPQLR